MSDASVLTPLAMAEQVRQMVDGRYGIVFADLFAADGVLEYPFAPPGMPGRLEGRDAIRAYHEGLSAQSRSTFELEEATLVAYQTIDPEVVVVEIEHHGTSHILGGPYRNLAIAVMRVRDGEIVSYRDYMDALNLARILGQSARLAAALTAEAA